MKRQARHHRRLESRRGQTLVEYALILAFVSVCAISVLVLLGNTTQSVFSTIISALSIAVGSH